MIKESSMQRIVTVTKRKRPQGTGSWQAYELGHDSYGHWLFTPAHSTHRGMDGETVGYCEVAQSFPGGPGRDSVVLMPHEGWWTATWTTGGQLRCSADIATPPTLTDNAWSFEDLELDPYLTRAGDYAIEDEDEFAEAIAAGLINATEEREAVRAAEDLRQAFTPDGPLVLAGESWLRQAVERARPPLPEP